MLFAIIVGLGIFGAAISNSGKEDDESNETAAEEQTDATNTSSKPKLSKMAAAFSGDCGIEATAQSAIRAHRHEQDAALFFRRRLQQTVLRKAGLLHQGHQCGQITRELFRTGEVALYPMQMRTGDQLHRAGHAAHTGHRC
jgi:hypothetical protein